MRPLAALFLCSLAAVASPPPECLPENDLDVLDAEAVVEVEIPEDPTVPESGDIRGRIRVAKLLAGEGVSVGDVLDVNIDVPDLYSCVGGGPTDEAQATHRKYFAGLFKAGARWILTLDRHPREVRAAGSADWTATRTYAVEGAGRADLDARLARRTSIAEIAALLIDLPALAPYWHAEEKGRKPLVLLETPAIRRSIRLEKFGEKVQVWSSPDAARPEVGILNISAIWIDGDTAKARLSYAIEGVAGEVELKREKGLWAVVKADLAEK